MNFPHLCKINVYSFKKLFIQNTFKNFRKNLTILYSFLNGTTIDFLYMQKEHNKYDQYYLTFIQNYVENDNKLTLDSYKFNTQFFS